MDSELFEVICVLGRLWFINAFTMWITIILGLWVLKMIIKGIFD